MLKAKEAKTARMGLLTIPQKWANLSNALARAVRLMIFFASPALKGASVYLTAQLPRLIVRDGSISHAVVSHLDLPLGKSPAVPPKTNFTGPIRVCVCVSLPFAFQKASIMTLPLG